jgi:hypothetical protein
MSAIYKEVCAALCDLAHLESGNSKYDPAHTAESRNLLPGD